MMDGMPVEGPVEGMVGAGPESIGRTNPAAMEPRSRSARVVSV